ncbi:unnamed protein product [Amoebophrya sp. A120]|nr:unnamed protein product [Amoebophrya sp. A120]|eukprot:GSA120T00012175001.1
MMSSTTGGAKNPNFLRTTGASSLRRAPVPPSSTSRGLVLVNAYFYMWRCTSTTHGMHIKVDDHDADADISAKVVAQHQLVPASASTSSATSSTSKIIHDTKLLQQTPEECMCVNSGLNADRVSDRFTPAPEGMPNQTWFSTTADASGKYPDSPYGQVYTDQYGGPADYGEYCRAWEDECASIGGKAGETSTCAIREEDCGTALDTRPVTCSKTWCYIRTSSAVNGNIAKTDANFPPVCSNIPAANLTVQSRDSVHLWWSYDFCTTTTTTTTSTLAVETVSPSTTTTPAPETTPSPEELAKLQAELQAASMGGDSTANDTNTTEELLLALRGGTGRSAGDHSGSTTTTTGGSGASTSTASTGGGHTTDTEDAAGKSSGALLLQQTRSVEDDVSGGVHDSSSSGGGSDHFGGGQDLAGGSGYY